MTSPVISVIVASYNQERYISRCLRSLISQTIARDKFEIVVINDGSTDRSASVLGEFADETVLINNEKNIGLPASLNKAIRRARAPFVVRVDADDYVNAEFCTCYTSSCVKTNIWMQSHVTICWSMNKKKYWVERIVSQTRSHAALCFAPNNSLTSVYTTRLFAS